MTPVPPVVLPGLLQAAQNPDAVEWEPFCPGVQRSWLFRTPPDGPSAALIRFAPGARVPLHEHTASEYILVLSGSQEDENGTTTAGTLIHNPAGTRHRIHSADGCVVLAIYERPVRFLEPLPTSA